MSFESFMSMDVSRFEGEWIALDKDKVIAHGKSFKRVFSKARKLKKCPFVARVPDKGVMLY